MTLRGLASICGKAYLRPSCILANKGLSCLPVKCQRFISTSPEKLKSEPKHRIISFSNVALLTVVFGMGYAAAVVTKKTKEENNYGNKAAISSAEKQLREAFPEANAVSTDPDELDMYSSSHVAPLPFFQHSILVRVKSTEDVVKVVNISRKFRIPLTVYSGGTSVEGHFAGHPEGSICIDMSGMDKILEIHESDSDLVCQAGAKWEEINATLEQQGIPLFFPLDPGPGATIGGMIATGCSGTNAVRYGTAKGELFLNLTVVLPSGEVIKTRRRARKSAAGFDVTKLFVGSEGTLGIITEATIRLHPKLPTTVAMVQFKNINQAVSAVDEILKSANGQNIQCVELLDDNMVKAINENSNLPEKLPISDTLFFKIQGTPEMMNNTGKVIQGITKKHGGSKFVYAKDERHSEALWNTRKMAFYAAYASVPGCQVWTTDVCVPVSKLPELVYETKKDFDANGLKSTILGHVGDGNFHALIMFMTKEELEIVREAVHRLIHRALALDGTCTGEHGIGIGKKEFMIPELGEGTVKLMKDIKMTIDPWNLFNPGKLYPDRHPSVQTDESHK